MVEANSMVDTMEVLVVLSKMGFMLIGIMVELVVLVDMMVIWCREVVVHMLVHRRVDIVAGMVVGLMAGVGVGLMADVGVVVVVVEAVVEVDVAVEEVVAVAVEGMVVT